MAYLEILTLGGVSITLAREEIHNTLAGKSVALITLLLTGEKLTVRKSRLMSLLWENSDEEACRNNLRFNLWGLKKSIPADGAGQEFILSDRSTVSINPAFDFVADILELHRYQGETSLDIATLLKAKALFRGEYLEGFYLKDCADYAETILMERIACQNLQIELLERVYQHYHAQKDAPRATEALNECLAIDPYNEHYALLMLKSLLEQGKNTQAVSFYKSFTDNLRRHLNIASPKELSALFNTLRPGPEEKPASTAQNSTAVLTVETFYLSGADWFWLGDALAQLAKACPLDQLPLSDAHKAGLALMYPAIGAAPVVLPDGLLAARLVSAFYALLGALPCEGVSLRVAAGKAPDPGLTALAELLARRPLSGVDLVIT